MAKFTQANRSLTVHTPLGDETLLLEGYRAQESISDLFRLELSLLADTDTAIAFDRLLGQTATIKQTMPDGSARHFNGIISRFGQGGTVATPLGAATLTRYEAELVPKAWLLTRTLRSRIFQQKSVVDILKVVLAGLDVSWRLQGTFEPRDYCVQYRESDWDFARRLMEEEGIYFYFTHAESAHTMVVANAPGGHVVIPGESKVIYDDQSGDVRDEGHVFRWTKTQELRAGKSTLWDYSFEMPDKHLEASQQIQASAQVGTQAHSLTPGTSAQLELYDYPGAYAQRFDGVDPGGAEQASQLSKIFQDNVRTVGIRMQQEAAQALVISGEATCRQFASGHKFSLTRHAHANGDYVLTRVEHFASLRGSYVDADDGELEYRNQFTCLPANLPYRPRRVTRRPTVMGSQTAIVVGPPGQEIMTDKYGRVKVQFHWDREGKQDANSSCWIRVGTPWAGKNWGLVHIPRIGQEVIVDFLEGDPDQPIIVGSVYNAEQMPPYKLPDNMTRSGLKTRSTPQADAEFFNELRFEDKKDAEEVYFHAQKDFLRVVENNDTLRVGSDQAEVGSQTIEIYKDRTETVKTGNEKLTVEKGTRTVIVNSHDSHTIQEGNREVKVEKGNDTHDILKGNREVKIDAGNDSLTITQGNQTIKISSGKCTLEAMQGIELKVGSNSIKIEPAGITIKGTMLSMAGDAKAELKSPMTEVKGDGMLTLKGGVTMIN